MLRILSELLPKLSPSAFPSQDIHRLPAPPAATPSRCRPSTPTSLPPHTPPPPPTSQPHRAPLSTPTFPDHMQYRPLRHSHIASSPPPPPPHPPPPTLLSTKPHLQQSAPAQDHSGGPQGNSDSEYQRQANEVVARSSGSQLSDSMMIGHSEWHEGEAWWMQPARSGLELQHAHSSYSSLRQVPFSGAHYPPHPTLSPPPPSAAAPPRLPQRQDAYPPHLSSHANSSGDSEAWDWAAAGLVAAQAELQDVRLCAWRGVGPENNCQQQLTGLLREEREQRGVAFDGWARFDARRGARDVDADDKPQNSLQYVGIASARDVRSASPLVSSCGLHLLVSNARTHARTHT